MSRRPEPRRERWIRRLTRLFPRSFRDDYENELQEVLRADHESSGGDHRFWGRVVVSSVGAALREHLDDAWSDLRFGLRSLRRQPLFVLTATLSLGLGIGALVTTAATLDHLFLQPIPGLERGGAFGRSSLLVNVKPYSDVLETFALSSRPDFEELRDNADTLAELAGFHGTTLAFHERDGEPEVTSVQLVTANYFDALAVRPFLGRYPSAEEERSQSPVAVLSHWMWQHRFGAPEQLPEIWINGLRHQVVGVAAPGFRGHFKGFRFDLFVPFGMAESLGLPPRSDRGARWIEMVGRLAPSADLGAARAELAGLAAGLAERYPVENADLSLQVEPMTGIDADFRTGLGLFLLAGLAICTLVLLVATLNVTSMMLSRVVARRPEIAVRRALGAPRSRVARQFFTESLIVASLGGVFGLLCSRVATHWVATAFASVDSRISLEIGIGALAWWIAAVASVGVAALSSVLARVHFAAPFQGAASAVRALSSGQRWRRGLVVLQVLLSFAILVSASLFLQAFRRAEQLDSGFKVADVFLFTLDPELIRMEPESHQGFFEAVTERAAELPGVEAVALSSRLPLGLGARFFPAPIDVAVAGLQPPPGRDAFAVEHTIVSAGYFETLRIPLQEGRLLALADRRDGAPVVVVNEQFARRFFADGAVGRTVEVAGLEREIVGVVRNTAHRRLDEEPLELVYLPFEQSPRRRALLMVRSSPGLEGVEAAVRGVVREIAPQLPVEDPRSYSSEIASSLLPQRVGATTSLALGSLGALLSVMGLYGVLAFWVSSRSRELGLRVSMGARPGHLVGQVLRQGLGLTAVGVALGVPLAVAVARLIRGFLLGSSAVDPLSYVAVAVLMILCAAVAALVPARRALRLDPLQALRSE